VVRALHIFKLNAVHELWMKILRDRSFIYPFMDEISVGLTSMFRDPVLWKRLRYQLNNVWNKKPSLAIWHAGCSTGEEVYTMGIVIKESGYTHSISAWATDMSNQAIATAQRGEYNILKMDEYDKNYREYNPAGTVGKYFERQGDMAKMDASLISHVAFENHNLITSPFTRKFDIIFCRNVMIYFDNEAKRKLFDRFHASLNPGGLFIIGFYDAVLPMMDGAKFSVLDMDAKIFQKV
jgi:chemotaxis protein methyltransferase CheR